MNLSIRNTLLTSLLQLQKMLWPGLSLKPGMRIDAIKIHRSAVYYLINTVTPINHAFKAKLDTYGSVIVVGLTLGVVSLVRLFLGWVH
jgi:hypothetical protein